MIALLDWNMRFAQPWVLLTLLVLPLYWWLQRQSSRRSVIRYSSLTALRAAAPASRLHGRMLLPLLRTLALAALIIAVARPQKPNASTRIFAEGIAIQLVVDTSGSMLDFDLSPRGQQMDRLDVVKQVVQRFVQGDGNDLPGRRNDLIGLIRFAGYADSICPLTLDHDALLRILAALQIVRTGQSDEDGTAIGDGLALAVERLRDLKRNVGSGEQLTIRSRIVVLLTDGEHNRGLVTPEQAGDLAALHDIRVYTILAGTGQRSFPSRLPVNDAALRKIADVTGGRHFQATDADSLAQIYSAIDELERSRVEERTFASWDELGQAWIVIAFSAVALQTLLDATWLRKTP